MGSLSGRRDESRGGRRQSTTGAAAEVLRRWRGERRSLGAHPRTEGAVPLRRNSGRNSMGRDGLDLAAALLVRLDCLLQVAVLGAREEAELVEAGEVLLGLRQVVEREIGFA